MKFQCKGCGGIVDVDFEAKAVNCGICNAINPVPAPMSAGVVIDDFRIEKLLCDGGMGNVYLAHEFALDREVALKILKSNISENTEARNSFIKEARSVASLNHNNIIQAFKVGMDGGELFFAMEYVEGKTLQQMMKEEGQLEETQILDVAYDVVKALGHAWEKRQLVHRDIKPENIMITNDGLTKLMDLGLSCTADEEDDNPDKISGTPHYISPEQILGEDVDIRTDFYCLGATLYHLLSGHFPFEGSLQEIVRQHIQVPPPSLKKARSGLHEQTVKIIHKMMRKEPERRFASAESLMKELKQCKKQIINMRKSKKHISIKPIEVVSHARKEKSRNRKDEKSQHKAVAVLAVMFLIILFGFLFFNKKSPSAKTDKETVQTPSEKIPVKNVSYEGMVHRYSFNKSFETSDAPATPDSVKEANLLMFGNVELSNGQLCFNHDDAGKAKISGSYKKLLDSSFLDSESLTNQAWFSCTSKEYFENNGFLKMIFDANKVDFDNSKIYYFVRVMDGEKNSLTLYLGEPGGKLHQLSVPLKVKLALPESSSVSLRSLLGFKGKFKGRVDEMRIWNKPISEHQARQMFLLGPDKLQSGEKRDNPTVNNAGEKAANLNLAMNNPTAAILIDEKEEWHYRMGTSGDKKWREFDFKFSNSWKVGKTRMGSNKGALTKIEPHNKSWLFRKSFSLDKPEDLVLTAWADDGCVAYVNNVEVGRYNMPEGEVSRTTKALKEIKLPPGGGSPFKIPAGLLRTGENVLCISVHDYHKTKAEDIVFGAVLKRSATVLKKDPSNAPEGLVHRYSFTEIIDGKLRDSIGGQNYFVKGGVKVTDGRVIFRSNEDKAAMRGTTRATVEKKFEGVKEFTIESWFNCREEFVKTNMFLNHIVNDHDLRFEANKDYYMAVTYHESKGNYDIYLGLPGGGFRYSEKSAAKVITVPSLAASLKRMSCFTPSYEGQLIELRLWKKNFTRGQLNKHFKMGPDTLN